MQRDEMVPTRRRGDEAQNSGAGFKPLLSPSSSSNLLSASRGKCAKCGQDVTTDQIRDKLPNGTYVHADCSSPVRPPPRGGGMQRDEEVPARRPGRGDGHNAEDKRSRTMSPNGRSRTLSPVSARARMVEQARGARTRDSYADNAESMRRPRTRSPVRDLSESQTMEESFKLRQQIAHLEQLKVCMSDPCFCARGRKDVAES